MYLLHSAGCTPESRRKMAECNWDLGSTEPLDRGCLWGSGGFSRDPHVPRGFPLVFPSNGKAARLGNLFGANCVWVRIHLELVLKIRVSKTHPRVHLDTHGSRNIRQGLLEKRSTRELQEAESSGIGSGVQTGIQSYSINSRLWGIGFL